ncbi:MAG: hypothetical protein HQK83_13730 [Fibrobacteria bacterium]|nr:hypothetical protein [Fibrobacteria bacterium]
MRAPIKLNKAYWPTPLTRLIPSTNNPLTLLDNNISPEQFSQAVSVFKFGTTLKSTRAFRFPLTVKSLSELSNNKPSVILDVGASDGITSSHVMKQLQWKKYFVTDRNIDVYCREYRGTFYFFDSLANCVLIATNKFVIYREYEDAVFPLNIIAKHFFSTMPPEDSEPQKIRLINPAIHSESSDVFVYAYDIFTAWEQEPADLVIAANILNRDYFSDAQILRAIQNLRTALKEGGRLTIIDNRENERSSIFRLEKAMLISEHDINGGTEIKSLVLSLPAA